MHREESPPTFVDVLMPEELGRNKRLDRIDEMLDWDPVARLVSEIHSLRRGAPSYRPLTMVKVLLLEQWYTLSDPEMEEALDDRLSFRRFVGLGIDDGTPDPLDHKPVPFQVGQGQERRVVRGDKRSVGGSWDDGQRGDVDGCDTCGGSGASSVA